MEDALFLEAYIGDDHQVVAQLETLAGQVDRPDAQGDHHRGDTGEHGHPDGQSDASRTDSHVDGSRNDLIKIWRNRIVPGGSIQIRARDIEARGLRLEAGAE